MDIALVWNAAAGSAAGIEATDVQRRIADATSRNVRVLACEPDRAPHMLAREAIAAGARMVIAAGGDGTVSACAGELIGSRSALGVIPLGTSNSFAAALEIPDDSEAAIALLATGERRVIDAAVVERRGERRTMILHCMIGLHADTIAETSTASKRRWGVLAYAGSALRHLASLEPFAVELVTAQHVVRCKAIQISAANIAPLKTVLAHGPSHLLGDDGRVDVTIVAAETIAEAIATGVHLWRSGRDHQPATRDNVGSFSSKRIEIKCEPAQHVLVDGEPFGETPVTITTMPRALTVIAQRAALAEGDPIEAPLEGLPDLEVERRR